MCLNCGCGQPDERHGEPANIVLDDLRAAAAANQQTLSESARHIAEAVASVAGDEGGHAGADRDGLANPAGTRGPATKERGTPATES